MSWKTGDKVLLASKNTGNPPLRAVVVNPDYDYGVLVQIKVCPTNSRIPNMTIEVYPHRLSPQKTLREYLDAS